MFLACAMQHCFYISVLCWGISSFFYEKAITIGAFYRVLIAKDVPDFGVAERSAAAIAGDSVGIFGHCDGFGLFEIGLHIFN